MLLPFQKSADLKRVFHHLANFSFIYDERIQTYELLILWSISIFVKKKIKKFINTGIFFIALKLVIKESMGKIAA